MLKSVVIHNIFTILGIHQRLGSFSCSFPSTAWKPPFFSHLLLRGEVGVRDQTWTVK